MKPLRATVHGLLARAGYRVERTAGDGGAERLPDDFTRLHAECRSYTMTSLERMFALYQATRYVVDKGLEGAVVECGVWKGGSMMLVALTLIDMKDDRDLWLYDTFEGMPEPSQADVAADGADVAVKWERSRRPDRTSDWCRSPLDECRRNVESTGIAPERLNFVKGRVEDTLPRIVPDKIALLRLDTDWYDSTRHELVHLFPRLAEGGVLILDDYGHWEGQRRAMDEYCRDHGVTLLLNRIDRSGRIAVR